MFAKICLEFADENKFSFERNNSMHFMYNSEVRDLVMTFLVKAKKKTFSPSLVIVNSQK